MAGTYVAATADANRWEVLREAFDLAGHGLRVRLGYMLYQLFDGRMNGHHEYLRIDPAFDRHTAGFVMDYSPVPVLVAATALVLSALAGRRSWIRWTAAATVAVAAVTILVVFELRRGDHIFVMTTLVLAVPSDATSFTGQRVHAVVAAVLACALAVGLRDALVPGAAALACAPWLIQPLTGDLYDIGFSGAE
ncbi:hypothetical protein [Catenulispora rubra]|uniref:hypothetical protein n=1 Tax=Catenulispora rubra TaxID=280293 RepID=UPI001E5B60EB|nr:hypothetical protein [Catenulispora rubra]